jgi:hypothetical protein
MENGHCILRRLHSPSRNELFAYKYLYL